MKTITLTKGAVALVDDEDYERVSAVKWYLGKRGYPVTPLYLGRDHARKRPKTRHVTMHRFVLNCRGGDGTRVDHINGDKCDNRKSNLRFCSQNENTCNRGPQRNSRSGVKGVFWVNHAKLYRATITRHGQKYELGYHKTLEEAAQAYNEAARKLHGEFAYLNPI